MTRKRMIEVGVAALAAALAVVLEALGVPGVPELLAGVSGWLGLARPSDAPTQALEGPSGVG